MPLACWSLLSRSSSIVRSSHCIAVTKSGILVTYGGELTPRIPVDNEQNVQNGALRGSVHTFDLKKKQSDLLNGWETASPNLSPHSGFMPDARVGATTVFEDGELYLWGGRGGIDMAPLRGDQTGIFRGKIDFDGDASLTRNINWEFLPASNPSEAPVPTSYHSAVSHQGNIYIHAGCPTTGRLSALHSFDISSNTWKELASAPDPPRGGSALAVTNLPVAGPVILRYGGFSGYQLPQSEGTIDIYVINTNQWHTVQPSPDASHGNPGARSVHGFVTFQSSNTSVSGARALLYHGERDASNLGHAGAGSFWEDVWLLSKAGSEVTEGWSWKKVDVPDDSPKPEARGWFPSASWVDGNGDTRTILHGGLLSSNERSGELWELAITE